VIFVRWALSIASFGLVLRTQTTEGVTNIRVPSICSLMQTLRTEDIIIAMSLFRGRSRKKRHAGGKCTRLRGSEQPRKGNGEIGE